MVVAVHGHGDLHGGCGHGDLVGGCVWLWLYILEYPLVSMSQV